MKKYKSYHDSLKFQTRETEDLALEATDTKQKTNHDELECGPMPNVTAALPNIGGVLCRTPQSLTDVHCSSAVQ